MMKKLYTSGLAILLLLMTGCASVTKDIVIDTQTSPLAKLDSYKTYAWLGKMSILRDPGKKWQPPKMNISGDIKYCNYSDPPAIGSGSTGNPAR